MKAYSNIVNAQAVVQDCVHLINLAKNSSTFVGLSEAQIKSKADLLRKKLEPTMRNSYVVDVPGFKMLTEDGQQIESKGLQEMGMTVIKQLEERTQTLGAILPVVQVYQGPRAQSGGKKRTTTATAASPGGGGSSGGAGATIAADFSAEALLEKVTVAADAGVAMPLVVWKEVVVRGVQAAFQGGEYGKVAILVSPPASGIAEPCGLSNTQMHAQLKGPGAGDDFDVAILQAEIILPKLLACFREDTTPDRLRGLLQALGVFLQELGWRVSTPLAEK